MHINTLVSLAEQGKWQTEEDGRILCSKKDERNEGNLEFVLVVFLHTYCLIHLVNKFFFYFDYILRKLVQKFLYHLSQFALGLGKRIFCNVSHVGPILLAYEFYMHPISH